MYPLATQPQLTGLLTVYEGPKLLPLADVMACRTYRDAVRLCFLRKPRPHMTKRTLCEEVNEGTVDGARMRASHLTEYLSDDEASRDMPARFVPAFEISMCNRAITQWLTWRAGLHITWCTGLELLAEQQARRVA